MCISTTTYFTSFSNSNIIYLTSPSLKHSGGWFILPKKTNKHGTRNAKRNKHLQTTSIRVSSIVWYLPCNAGAAGAWATKKGMVVTTRRESPAGPGRRNKNSGVERSPVVFWVNMPSFTRFQHPFQVVVWDFWTINSIMIHPKMYITLPASQDCHYEAACRGCHSNKNHTVKYIGKLNLTTLGNKPQSKRGLYTC